MADFNSITGLDYVKDYLQRALRLRRVSHAYIFSADEGCGKKTMAEAFAKTLLCEKYENNTLQGSLFAEDEATDGPTNPCNQCTSCKQVESGNHPDLIWVHHEKPNLISIDEIREQVNSTISIRPYKADYKVYIIPDADLMNVQAQNAILKTIEEPPEYAVILLLTSNETGLLETIHSRCVMMRFQPIPDALVKRYLMKELQLPDYKAEGCASYGRGNLGRAVKMATDDQFYFLKEEALSLAKSCRSLRLPDLLNTVKGMGDHKTEMGEYLDFLLLWFRDVLVFKATGDAQLLVFRDEEFELNLQAQRMSYEGIAQVLEGIEKAQQRLNANVSFDLTMELLVYQMKQVV